METKLAKLKAAASSGDWLGALRIAAKFPQLGEQKAAITRAWAVAQNPQLYREMGQDPAALMEAGVAALKERYSLA